MAFALFIDVLGTGRAMEALPDQHIFRGRDSSRDAFRESIASAARVAGSEVLLTAVFSDCAYVVTKSATGSLRAARVIMEFCVGRVPVRGGIGLGNFALDRTMHEWDGMAPIAEASFFGSALVRAHRAEQSGEKGFRILVHESAAPGLEAENPPGGVYEERPAPTERSGFPPFRPGTLVLIPDPKRKDVSHEVCYIGDDPVAHWYDGVDSLERQYRPDVGAQIHYSETRAALTRFAALRDQL